LRNYLGVSGKATSESGHWSGARAGSGLMGPARTLGRLGRIHPGLLPYIRHVGMSCPHPAISRTLRFQPSPNEVFYIPTWCTVNTIYSNIGLIMNTSFLPPNRSEFAHKVSPFTFLQKPSLDSGARLHHHTSILEDISIMSCGG